MWYIFGSGDGYLTGVDLNCAYRHFTEYLVVEKVEAWLRTAMAGSCVKYVEGIDEPKITLDIFVYY